MKITNTGRTILFVEFNVGKVKNSNNHLFNPKEIKIQAKKGRGRVKIEL